MTAPSLARILTDAGAFTNEPFTLLDVGCSDGIFNPALDFIPSIRAVGFDPVTDEVERLQAASPDRGVNFECALVGDPGWVPLPPRTIRPAYSPEVQRPRTASCTGLTTGER